MPKTNEERIRDLEKRLDHQDKEIEALIDLIGFFVLQETREGSEYLN